MEPVRKIMRGKGNYFEATVEKILPDEKVRPADFASRRRGLIIPAAVMAPNILLDTDFRLLRRLWWPASQGMWASQRHASRWEILLVMPADRLA